MPENHSHAKAPSRLKKGQMTVLREIASGANDLGLSTNAMTRFLASLRIPILAIGGGRYYNEAVFEIGIIVLSYFRSSGFAAPGSDGKDHRIKASPDQEPIPLPSSVAETFPEDKDIAQAFRALVRACRAKEAALKTPIRRLLMSTTMSSLSALKTIGEV